MLRQFPVYIQSQCIVPERCQQIRQQNVLQPAPVKVADQTPGNRTPVIIVEQHKAAEKDKGWRSEFKKDVDPVKPIIVGRIQSLLSGRKRRRMDMQNTHNRQGAVNI
ncbi:hypothetical protein D3C85_1460830 [compost metagenome]